MADSDTAGPNSEEWVVLSVRLRAEQAAILRASAAREGASAEELAALWLEEKASEARKLLPTALTGQQPAQEADE